MFKVQPFNGRKSPIFRLLQLKLVVYVYVLRQLKYNNAIHPLTNLVIGYGVAPGLSKTSLYPGNSIMLLIYSGGSRCILQGHCPCKSVFTRMSRFLFWPVLNKSRTSLSNFIFKSEWCLNSRLMVSLRACVRVFGWAFRLLSRKSGGFLVCMAKLSSCTLILIVIKIYWKLGVSSMRMNNNGVESNCTFKLLVTFCN